MGFLDSLKKALGREDAAPSQARGESPAPRAEELRVPEVTAAQLMADLQQDRPQKPLLLDCREEFERRQAYIPDSLHIAMNTIPNRLGEIDRAREVVVYCAHGNRSYGVAGWLIQQGYTAASLKGGIVEWQARGGPTQSSLRRS